MLTMMRRSLSALLGALILVAATASWAAEDEKQIINGPSKTSFGGLHLVLGQGASAEVAYQPDATKLVVRTLVGEARVITSAKNLILVESTEGRIEILLPNGRVILVEPGKAEIVGRTLGEDPGSIIIRLSGTGPIAQQGPVDFVQSLGAITILQFAVTSPGSPEDFPLNDPTRGPTPVSPSTQ